MKTILIILSIIIVMIIVFFISKCSLEKYKNSQYDFIIIGAGISGLYASYRLHQLYKNPKILIIEKQDRVGGRLISVSIPIIEKNGKKTTNNIEKGGMRILLGKQPLLQKLITDFKMPLHKLPPSNKNNFNFYRGTKVYPQDIKSGNIPFRMFASEYHKTSGELIDMGVDLIKKENKHKTFNSNTTSKLKFWESLFYKGLPLTEWTFEAFLNSYLSSQALAFVYISFGYDAEFRSANLSSFLYDNEQEATIFHANTAGEKLVSNGTTIGFSHLAKLLHDYLKKKGDTFLFSTKFIKCHVHNNDTIEVHHESFSKDKSQYLHTKKHFCTKLILSVPIDILQFLDKTKSITGLNQKKYERFRYLLSGVKNYSAIKQFVVFDKPWWEKKYGIVGGRNNTSLAIRQIYYWLSNKDENGVMLLYGDAQDADTIQQFLQLPKEPPHTQEEANQPNKLNKQKRHFLRKFIADAHGIDMNEIPPIKAYYGQYWDIAWELFQAGYKPSEIINESTYILKPVYLVGVGCSASHGWCEGALSSVEQLIDSLTKN